MNSQVEQSYQTLLSLKEERASLEAGEHADLAKSGSLIEELGSIDTEKLVSDDEKTAFWLNIYNALICWLTIQGKFNGTPLRTLRLLHFSQYKIGKWSLTPDEIEHGILRKNRKMPTLPLRVFRRKDPRNSLAPERFDYRIHFALNCGAVSCPPVAGFQADDLNFQLDGAERFFIQDNFIYDVEFHRLAFNSIFNWYKKDFSGKFLDDPQFKHYRKTEIRYDWTPGIL